MRDRSRGCAEAFRLFLDVARRSKSGLTALYQGLEWMRVALKTKFFERNDGTTLYERLTALQPPLRVPKILIKSFPEILIT